MKFLILRKLHDGLYGLYRANKYGAIAFLRKKTSFSFGKILIHY
nr:MAG TPA: hypothetical protein [Crassvirales sp.]